MTRAQISMRRGSRPYAWRILLGAASSAVTVAVIVPVRDAVNNANIALGLAVIVLAAAALGGRAAAIAAAFSSGAAFDFFLTRPFNSFRISAADDIQTTLLLIVVGLIGSELVERVRQSSTKAATARSELDSFHRRAELAAGAETPGELIQVATHELTRALGLKSCRYVAGSTPLAMPELRHNAIRVPAGIGPPTGGLVALPVRAHGQLQGHLVLAFPVDTVCTALTSDQRHASLALADQVGVGLLRFRGS